ncbi:MAG TPA: beta-hydroxyacyl-ACP dehydratase [Planctomycetaceae bacterium]|nr:beta-hydroxyacyl-ACP dehydratase [Planctomycetaceae bacterium]
MRFILLDRITELHPGDRISAVKNLTMAEEYLGDHFPLFPVMPGVLMLQAMIEAGAWLVRATDDFAHSMVVLRKVANVKYGQFVQPGQTLDVSAEIVDRSDGETRIKAKGTMHGRLTVAGRLTLASYNLSDSNPARTANDEDIRRAMQKRFGLLYDPQWVHNGLENK